MALNETQNFTTPSLVSPTKKRTRDALYHPYANGILNGSSEKTPTLASLSSSIKQYNGTKSRSGSSSSSKGSKHDKNDSRVQYMVSLN